MHIKTLLNYVTKFKCFIFQTSQLDRKKNNLLISVAKTAGLYVQAVDNPGLIMII